MKDLNLSDTSVSDTAQRKMEYLITGGFRLHELHVIGAICGQKPVWNRSFIFLSMLSRQDIKARQNMIQNCLVKMHCSHLTMREMKFVSGRGVPSLSSLKDPHYKLF